MEIEVDIKGYSYAAPGHVRRIKGVKGQRITYDNNGYSDVLEGTYNVACVGDTVTFLNLNRTVQQIDRWLVEISNSRKENMNGKVYDAVIVRTKTVPAGAGVSTGVQVSEIVHEEGVFTAPSDETARALVLAKAIAAGVDVVSQLEPTEVKLRVWG